MREHNENVGILGVACRMIIYQNTAQGLDCLDGRGCRRDKYVYPTREAALAAQPAFVERCLTPLGEKDLGFLQRVDEVWILELELVDS